MNIKIETLERAAKALAEAVNGGCWEVDYTPHQKGLWRRRIEAAMRVEA